MTRTSPKAKASAVAAASQGSTRLTTFRKRVGLARSMMGIGGLLVDRGDHSNPWRNAAAAATGPSTKLAKDSAQRMVKGGPKGAGPTMAALAAATPKISTGIVNGSTNTANNKPPRRNATDSAAPI